MHYPLNPRTRLGVGDLKRMAGVFFGFAVVGFVAVPWLRWFEGDWAEEYYSETYADSYLSGFLGNFDTHADRHPRHRGGLRGDSRRLHCRRFQARAEEGCGAAVAVDRD